MSRPRKQVFVSCAVKPKTKALRHFKVEALCKFADSGLFLSQWAQALIFQSFAFDQKQSTVNTLLSPDHLKNKADI